jgi:hypothetical protein
MPDDGHPQRHRTIEIGHRNGIVTQQTRLKAA